MKRLICALLMLSVLFSLISCSQPKYEPRESTEEESRVMMTLSYEGKEYEVKYELYRALYLNCASDYADRGEDFFETEEGALAITAIQNEVIDLCSDIYAIMHIAGELGYDPYSAAVDEQISSMIADDVDNSYYAGDYEKYLSDLAKLNMNYAVQDLMLRYQLAHDYVINHYTGSLDFDNPTSDMEEGAITFTEDDVREFYFSDSSVRASIITVSGALTLADAERIREGVATKPTMSDALNYAISATISDPSDVLDGVIIGTKSIDFAFYGDVKDQAISLDVGAVSDVIEISNELDKEYWILYGLDKDAEHFEKCYDDIASSYVSQLIGEIIMEVKDTIASSVQKTDVFSEIAHGDIKM